LSAALRTVHPPICQKNVIAAAATKVDPALTAVATDRLITECTCVVNSSCCG
jgi:hypothetical protein